MICDFDKHRTFSDSGLHTDQLIEYKDNGGTQQSPNGAHHQEYRMTRIFQHKTAIEFNDQEDEDSSQGPAVLPKYFVDGAPSEEDVSPLGQDLDATDINQQHEIVNPKRREY